MSEQIPKYGHGYQGAWVRGPGDTTHAQRQSESNWAIELANILAAADPDEVEPVKGKAMANLFGKKARERSAGIYNMPAIKSTCPSEIPTYTVIRETKTTARVVNTLTGMNYTVPLPIREACKKAQQLNGDTHE